MLQKLENKTLRIILMEIKKTIEHFKIEIKSLDLTYKFFLKLGY